MSRTRKIAPPPSANDTQVEWKVRCTVEKEPVKEPKNVARPPADSKRGGGPAGVRCASNEEFAKAHRKTSMLHAGLFRRLAK